ncbi:hypothetical protein BJ322DRAFT_1110232 [Thelephora terrestris]|uniref:Phosphatidylglycerol/phosphatidylinositol transfer protein n=1 Tax=Thelephora terrestris TaxID=56493 RepID=A0A9P6HCS5_9AGAM|nr:hypothetical protein BJ322DRAFT_1110232 [Thelephora terrestris]
MARLFFLAVYALAFLGVASAVPALGGVHARGGQGFTSCAAGTNNVISFDISPDKPVAGEFFSVTVKASTPKQITNQSYFQLVVDRGSKQLWARTVDICELLSCPIQPGTYSVTNKVYIPKGVPLNEIDVRVKGFVLLHETLFCLDFTPN